MSRCIAFPPPGYSWEGVSEEALLELLKVKKEKIEAENQRKKEEKRKKRKEEMRKTREQDRQKRHSHHRSCNCHKRKRADETSDNYTTREDDLQGLERSKITAEKKQPATILLSQYESSDNNNNVRRKRPKWSPGSSQDACKFPSCGDLLSCFGETLHTTGRIICIDIQLEKYNEDQEKGDFDVQKRSELAQSYIKEQVCSNYEQASQIKEMFCIPYGEFTSIKLATPCRKLCQSSEQAEVGKKAELAFKESCLLHTESEFENLIANWVPPSMPFENQESEDLEWLFGKSAKRQHHSNMAGLPKAENEDLSHESPALYPTAQYLPHADIYALPYAVPF